MDKILKENKLTEKMFSSNSGNNSKNPQKRQGQKHQHGKKSKNKMGHKNRRDSTDYFSPLPQRNEKPSQRFDKNTGPRKEFPKGQATPQMVSELHSLSEIIDKIRA